MKFLKNNLKLIIGIVVGVILASGITVYAYSYLASDVQYTNNKSVADALNDLYNNMSNETKSITSNGQQTLDKYYKNINVNVDTSTLSNLKTITAFANGTSEKKSNNITISKNQTAKFVCSIRHQDGNSFCRVYVNDNIIVNNTTTYDSTWTMKTFDVSLKQGDIVYVSVRGGHHTSGDYDSTGALIYIE